MAGTVKQDLTTDEAQLMALVRQAITDVPQDAAQLIADAKTQLSPLWLAFQKVLNGSNSTSAK